MKKRIFAIGIIGMLLLSCLTMTSVFGEKSIVGLSGNTIYVDDDADPSWYNATHVKTIQEGIDNASSGDTIYVYNGTYYENVNITKDLVNLIGEDRDTTIIDGNNSGNVIRIVGEYVNVSGFTLRNNSENKDTFLIESQDEINISSNVIIEGNKIIHTGFQIGIAIIKSHNNKILNNLIFGVKGAIGLSFFDSRHNNINGNTIRDGLGICLSTESFNNTFKENDLFNCTIEMDRYSIDNDIDTSNTVNNKPIYMHKDEIGINIPSDAGLIILVNCSSFLISNVDITGYYGVMLYFSNNNTIQNNKFDTMNSLSTNSIGIYLYYSDNNYIFGNKCRAFFSGVYLGASNNNSIQYNTIENCSYGIALEGSNFDSSIYHNSFFNNTMQAYDDYKNNSWNSTFGEGNYWDDFDEPSEGAWDNDSNGIVDTPYYIPSVGNKDNYPLMEPYSPTVEPDLEFGIAKYSFGEIQAKIKNIVEEELTGIDWNITVKGGLLNRINVSANGSIDELGPGITQKISTEPRSIVLRFGPVVIEVTATVGEYAFEETFYGFVIGRLFIDSGLKTL